MSSDDLANHRVRVREELDRAYRATATAAVHAHFRLAALHMNRIDELVRGARLAAVAEATSAPACRPGDVNGGRIPACRQ